MGLLNKLFGGGGEEGQGMAAQVLTQLIADLNLSSEQQNQIKYAFQSFREERKEAKSQGGDVKEQMKTHRQELKNKILGLLTEEQKQKFQANMEKYKEFFQK